MIERSCARSARTRDEHSSTHGMRTQRPSDHNRLVLGGVPLHNHARPYPTRPWLACRGGEAELLAYARRPDAEAVALLDSAFERLRCLAAAVPTFHPAAPILVRCNADPIGGRALAAALRSTVKLRYPPRDPSAHTTRH